MIPCSKYSKVKNVQILSQWDKNIHVHSTENNQKFSFRDTLRFVYKTQMLDQIHAAVPVVVSYCNEKIKNYDTEFVKYLHITQCIFVCVSG